MKYADNFARINARLRARGFTVVEVPGCWTRGRRRNGGPAEDFVSIETLTIHHTATGGSADYASLNLVTNGRPDLAGPLCNYGLGRKGTVYFVAAGAANHTGATWKLRESNKYAVGHECENDGLGEPWSEDLVESLTALVQEERVEFGVVRDDVLGHREICTPSGRKPDPAHFDMDAFRAATDYWEEDMANVSQDQLNDLVDAAGIIKRALGTKMKSRVEGSDWEDYLPAAVMNTNLDAFMLRRELAEVRGLVAGFSAALGVLAASKGADAAAIQAAAEAGAREALDSFTLTISKES